MDVNYEAMISQITLKKSETYEKLLEKCFLDCGFTKNDVLNMKERFSVFAYEDNLSVKHYSFDQKEIFSIEEITEFEENKIKTTYKVHQIN